MGSTADARTTRNGSRPRVEILLAKAYDPDPRVERTAQALMDAGYDVRVLAWDRSGRRPIEETHNGVPIRRIRVRSRPSRGWTQAFFLILFAIRALPLERSRAPRVLHAVNLPMLFVAILLAPLLGSPRPAIVYDAFEIHALMGVHRYPRWLILLITLIERYLPRFADLVITPGEDRRRYHEEHGIRSLAIPNWIEPPEHLPDREAARRELGIDPGKFVLLYTGGIIGSRDLETLVDHARRCPDDLVLIAGRGDAEQELRASAAGLPNVRLLGWVTNPAQLLAAADVLFYALKTDHPYAAHAAPNNLYQAIAYAIPLLHRNQGEIRIVASNQLIGRAFTDAASLDVAVDELRDPAANARVRESLRSMQDAYRWTRAAERLVPAYRRLVPEQARTNPQLMVLTRIWPTPQRPSVGTFVRQRVHDVPDVLVVRPRWPRLPRLLLYIILLLDGLRARAPLSGVEAHMLVPTGFVGLLIARLRRVPLVVYAHGGDVRGWWRRPLVMRILSRLVARSADAVLTNSEDTAAYLRQLGRDAQVVPPGIDLHRFQPSPRPNPRRVLYLGGRNRRKGYAVASRLADTLVGPWLNDIDPADVPALIAEHDVVLMPSIAEPFGLVAVEAIASGRWVVATDVGGLRDIIIDGVNGTLVSDGDYAGALARVPDYDPWTIAATVERFSLGSWQSAMDEVWQHVRTGRAMSRTTARG
jgi:glycosyltransferase involved in cell wall biosynthesis